MDWVQCDGGCNQWFHMLCVGLIKSEIKPDEDYVCKKCKRSTNTSTDKPQTATNNGAKKLKNGINNGGTATDTATSMTKKRTSRAREEAARDKTQTPTPIDTSELTTWPNSKENDSKSRKPTRSTPSPNSVLQPVTAEVATSAETDEALAKKSGDTSTNTAQLRANEK